MAKLHTALIDDLESASAALSAARDAIADIFGCGDELFDRLVAAQSAADVAASRLQDVDADTYGEMAHFGT